jgi:hypothetical protein
MADIWANCGAAIIDDAGGDARRLIDRGSNNLKDRFRDLLPRKVS